VVAASNIRDERLVYRRFSLPPTEWQVLGQT
jgi:hypothetical protein